MRHILLFSLSASKGGITNLCKRCFPRSP